MPDLNYLVYRIKCVLLLASAILVGCSIAMWAFPANAFTVTVHVLEYKDRPASFGDMNEAQCNTLKDEIEAETDPMEGLECVPYEVRREVI